MGTTDLSFLAKQSGLSAKQKADLKKRLMARKRELAASMKSVDQGLKALARKKRPAKRRAKR